MSELAWKIARWWPDFARSEGHERLDFPAPDYHLREEDASAAAAPKALASMRTLNFSKFVDRADQTLASKSKGRLGLIGLPHHNLCSAERVWRRLRGIVVR